jgi:hypothetical protein
MSQEQGNKEAKEYVVVWEAHGLRTPVLTTVSLFPMTYEQAVKAKENSTDCISIKICKLVEVK